MAGDQGVNLIEYPDAEMMMIDLANQIAGEINTALLQNDFATLAVPGGTTPGPVFDALCDAASETAEQLLQLSAILVDQLETNCFKLINQDCR